MITPVVSSIPPVNSQPTTPAAPQPRTQQTVKSGTLAGDQVTLKSAGQVDHDRDGD